MPKTKKPTRPYRFEAGTLNTVTKQDFASRTWNQMRGVPLYPWGNDFALAITSACNSFVAEHRFLPKVEDLTIVIKFTPYDMQVNVISDPTGDEDG